MQPGDRDRDHQQKAAAVAGMLPALIAYWDKDLVCRFANPSYLNWLGKEQSEVIGRDIASFLPEAVYTHYKRHIDGVLAGTAQYFELATAVPGSNGMRYDQVSFYPDIDAEGVKGFALLATDVTQQKKQIQSREETNNILGNQNKSLLNFANIVSHNLRSYAGNMETLLGLYETEQNTEEKKQVFGFLKEISADFKSSVENLADIVKVQNLGRVPTEQVNLHSYTVKAAEVLQLQVEETKARIHNNVNPGIYIEANAAYLESIILNFIDNAIKYRHPDRKPNIELSAMQVGNETVLNIKDNGLGINLDNDRHKLFGMYNTFHGNKNATGLGLFMVKQQVDSMGGYIGVESSMGHGTWFRVYFKTRAVAV